VAYFFGLPCIAHTGHKGIKTRTKEPVSIRNSGRISATVWSSLVTARNHLAAYPRRRVQWWRRTCVWWWCHVETTMWIKL